MIFPNHYQEPAPTYRWHLYGMRVLKKTENVLNKELSSLCQWFIDNKLKIHFGEDKIKSILFPKARGLILQEINIIGN